MSRGSWAAAIAGLVTLLALVPAARAQDRAAELWGVDPLDPPSVGEAELMRRTGIGVNRVTFYWRAIEPRSPTMADLLGIPRYDWRRTDRWVANTARGGVGIHALLFGSPSWLTPHGHYAPSDTAERRTGWRHFVRAVVGRYGRSGSFWVENPGIPARPIEIFQVWNEQNLAGQYRPRPNVSSYATLLQIASSEIRAADPEARVVLGGMVGRREPPSIGAATFLRRLYAIPGIGHLFDAVAVHPYSPGTRGIEIQVRRFLRVMRRAGDRSTPIEVTELGWSSERSDRFFWFVGPERQAELLRRSFRLLLRNRARWRIERVIWHIWRDVDAEHRACRVCHEFGLRRIDGSPKPAYRAYRRIATGRDRARPRRR